MTLQPAKPHRPFLIRKCIFFAGIFAGVITGYFLQNPSWGLCAYFGVVTLCDLLATYAFGLRASDLSDPKQLRVHEKITPFDLDRYYDSRRNIRILSLSFAALSQVLVFAPELFCAVYATVSVVCALYAKYALKIGGPKAFHIVELSESRMNHIGKESLKDAQDIHQGMSSGFGVYGVWKN